METHKHQSAHELEEAFFARQSLEQIQRMREEKNAGLEREELTRASGISRAEILDELRKTGIKPETLAALSLIPLIRVAWADGELDEKEKQAILQAVHDEGISKGSPSYEMLQAWISEEPEEVFYQTWADYVGALSEVMEGKAFNALREEILGFAHKVADASGGFLGLGKKTSSVEQKALDELEKAFH